jgi:hypothetical protein
MQQTSQIGAMPAEFRELENLVQRWSLATEHERRERRARAEFPELRAYYDVVGPRMRDIAAHLDTYPMGILPAPQNSLLQLALMYMEVAIAVEFYGRPELRDGFPRQRWVISPR